MIEYASAGLSVLAPTGQGEVFPAFKAKYIDTGKVHYVFREVLAGEKFGNGHMPRQAS